MAVTECVVPAFSFAPSVVFTRNVESGIPLVYLSGTRVMTLSEPLGEVCDALLASDLPLDEADLAELLTQGHWDLPRMSKALQALTAAGILREAGDVTEPSASQSSRRLEFQRPLMVKLTLCDPEALCRRISPLARPLRGRLGAVLTFLGAMTQLIFWIGLIHANGLYSAQGDSQPIVTLTFVLLTVTCLFHEMAHGIVLASAGGRPRRLGIMLFYLIPAFFCDVSDSFRLARRSHRWILAYGAGAALMPIVMVTWSLYAWVTRCWSGDVVLCVIVAIGLSLVARVVAGAQRSARRRREPAR